jgi:hypothetical protein
MANKDYRVIMRVEIERYVEAEDKHDALEKVDTDDMMHELKRYKVDTEYIVEEMFTDDHIETIELNGKQREVVKEALERHFYNLREDQDEEGLKALMEIGKQLRF